MQPLPVPQQHSARWLYAAVGAVVAGAAMHTAGQAETVVRRWSPPLCVGILGVPNHSQGS